MTEQTTALYRFFDDSGDLLYVGISMNPAARWSQHRQDKPWWCEVATVTIEAHSSPAVAEAAERVAIRSELPRYNVAHHPDRWERRQYVAHDGPYMGSYEIGGLLGVSRQRVSQLAGQPEFPRPAEVLSMGSVWRTKDVRAWAEKTERPIYE